MNYTNEQLDEARRVGIEAIDAHLAKLKEVATKPWPQVGDVYLWMDSIGDAITHNWVGSSLDQGRLAIGNCYRPEHRAYAERHVEAMKVQAELRRMPGVCQRNAHAWFIAAREDGDFALLTNCCFLTDPMAGVFFRSESEIKHAIDTITPRRLALFRDDYLQVPIDGVE